MKTNLEVQVSLQDTKQFEAVFQAMSIGLEALVYLGHLPNQRDTADAYRSRIIAALEAGEIGAELHS